MGRGLRRVCVVAVALAPPACSTYGRDDTTVIVVHDDASSDAAPPDDAGTSDAHVGPPDAEAGAPVHHLAFVTTSAFSPLQIRSPVGADELCATVAGSVGLGGTFRAWLSTSASNGDVAARLADDGPWLLRDGALVATTKSDLLDGVLMASIDVSESGAALNGVQVWTGTATNGTTSGNDCAGWMTTTGVGSCGVSDAVDASWTNASTIACNSQAHLYCFSQP